MDRKDEVQIHLRIEGQMIILKRQGLNSESLVVITNELGQVGIGLRIGTDVSQAQFFDQTVLTGLVSPLNPAFGLW